MIFLNAKGRPERETRELCEFLRYAENSMLENAMSEELKTLQWMVEGVRHDGRAPEEDRDGLKKSFYKI